MTEQTALQFPASCKTRKDEMREQAVAFHQQHPEVWKLFVKFTFDRINRGFKHYSARAIFHRIRWETDQAKDVAENEFKIGNNHSPFYARAFMRSYPQYGPTLDKDDRVVEQGFFRIREQISEKSGPSKAPPLGPRDYDDRPVFEQARTH
jgi:hypothetical protein